jgi:hypothetical protein
MSSSSAAIAEEPASAVAAVAATVKAVDDALESTDFSEFSDTSVQQLLTAAAKLYAAYAEQGGKLPATLPGALNATQGMIVTTALLRSVNVQLFELGLWQSWAGGGR